ncbi:hypothetical protein D7S86_23500 [Pararobbsia silviterrae]|uniref:Uncharacterized protein n=2 Tax=Pararobbsia silviterrae TaxID=1792498 RepID=A0A494XC18_9BURK|nr:hypothetical protein D7S86_23500 [Pararobbsia silviterrae]
MRAAMVLFIIGASVVCAPLESNAAGRVGGGGGARMGGAPHPGGPGRGGAQLDNSRADVRSQNVRSTSVNNVNVNRNVNVNVSGNDYHHGGWDDDYHPVATAAAVTATVAVTTAVVGSIVHSIPPNCMPVNYGGMVYQQCGSAWYQPQGGQYVVVNRPY